MTRKETVEKYIDAFLKGRSQSAVDKFMSKAEHLQYASIMQWRRRMQKVENTPKSTRDILELLHKAEALLGNAPDMTTDDRQTIDTALAGLHSALDAAYERARARRIQELEAKKQEIAAQLEQLRSE